MRMMAFKRSPDAVRDARRFVASSIRAHATPDDTALGGTVLDDSVLVASELVTNSVEHAHDASGVWVRVLVGGGVVRLEVWDDGRAGIPHIRSGENDFAECGRGFQLVNELAWRWGFWRSPGRTCCWAEIAGSAVVPASAAAIAREPAALTARRTRAVATQRPYAVSERVARSDGDRHG